MYESVKNSVAQGGVRNDFVPVFHRQLGGKQGGCAIVPVFHDLEQVAPLLFRQGLGSPVVKNQ